MYKMLWSLLMVSSLINGAATESLCDGSFDRLKDLLGFYFGSEVCQQSLEDYDKKTEMIEKDFNVGKISLVRIAYRLLECEVPRFFSIFDNQFADQSTVQSCVKKLNLIAANSDIPVYERLLIWFMLDEIAFAGDYQNEELLTLLDELYHSLNHDHLTSEGFKRGRDGALSDYLEQTYRKFHGDVLLNEILYRSARKNYLKGKMMRALFALTGLDARSLKPSLIEDISVLFDRIPELSQNREQDMKTYQIKCEEFEDEYLKKERRDPDDAHLKKLKESLDLIYAKYIKSLSFQKPR